MSFEVHFKNKEVFRPSSIKYSQVQLKKPDSTQSVLDNNGSLKFVGWSLNLENSFTVNTENIQVSYLPKSLSWLKYKAFNFFMIYTKDHIM